VRFTVDEGAGSDAFALHASAADGVSEHHVIDALKGAVSAVALKFPYDALALSSLGWAYRDQTSEALPGEILNLSHA
jgi:predicted exporter